MKTTHSSRNPNRAAPTVCLLITPISSVISVPWFTGSLWIHWQLGTWWPYPFTPPNSTEVSNLDLSNFWPPYCPSGSHAHQAPPTEVFFLKASLNTKADPQSLLPSILPSLSDHDSNSSSEMLRCHPYLVSHLTCCPSSVQPLTSRTSQPHLYGSELYNIKISICGYSLVSFQAYSLLLDSKLTCLLPEVSTGMFNKPLARNLTSPKLVSTVVFSILLQGNSILPMDCKGNYSFKT